MKKIRIDDKNILNKQNFSFYYKNKKRVKKSKKEDKRIKKE